MSACYNKITKWTQIGTALNTLALLWIGTTNTARYICPCPATLKKPQSDLDTNLPTNPGGNHIHIPSPPTAPPSNTPSKLISTAQQQKTSAKIHPPSHRCSTLLRPGSRLHTARCFKLPCISPVSPNRLHIGTRQMAT